MYELVLQHGICTITCVCVATPGRVSENSEGCQTTPNGVKVISWHSRSVSKHLTGVDEHTGVIEHPFLKFNTPFLTVGVHHNFIALQER